MGSLQFVNKKNAGSDDPTFFLLFRLFNLPEAPLLDFQACRTAVAGQDVIWAAEQAAR